MNKSRDPAQTARELTRGQRHAIAQATQVSNGPFVGKWCLRLRVGGVVRRNLIASGIITENDGGFLTVLGEQVRATLVTDPLEHSRHHFSRGGQIPRQVQA